MTDPDPPQAPDNGHPLGWKFLLIDELRQVALSRPWGQAVRAIGWVHLASFLVCQITYTAGVRASWVSILFWSSEIVAVLVAVRLVAGRGWFRTPAVGLIIRVWVTFLILSFNVASLNTLTGWSLDWFKPVWCTLASFGFATMAWLFGLRFLIPAFQMYFTGLLMVRFPGWNYVIHGLSWWAALQWVGWDLDRRRARLLRPEPSADHALANGAPSKAETAAAPV
jgi:hypothetical protein